jgi:hypothetical protein
MHGVTCKFKLRPLAVGTGRGSRMARLDEAGARAHVYAVQWVRRLDNARWNRWGPRDDDLGMSSYARKNSLWTLETAGPSRWTVEPC